jgi:ABC-type antimicrobial peptide transport system permease subunit
VLILSDGATDELFSNFGYSDTSNIERQVVPQDGNGQPVEVLQVMRGDRPVYLASRETYLVVNQPIPAPDGQPQRRRFVQLRGVVEPDISGLVHEMELEAGGDWFGSSGVQTLEGDAGAQEAIQTVVGQGVAGVLGKDQGKERLQVGDVFELGDRKWVVTGIMQSAGSTFDSEIWAKQELIGPMFRKEKYTSIVLRTANAASARILSDHLTSNFKEAAVQAKPETEYYAKLTETNQQFLAAIIFVAAIMAIGGVFGVMNTMFAAISQRTKDIGVLRLLGFSRGQILVSFLLETLGIALAGGLLGCAIGLLANGYGATSIVSSGMGGSPKSVALELIVDADTLAMGLVFTLVMGGLGGLLPALTAMRLRPLESLR